MKYLILCLIATNLLGARTVEDQRRLDYALSHHSQEKGGVPKTIHMIWIGSQAFPKDGGRHLTAWIDTHPDYTVKFWTDSPRSYIDPRAETVYLTEADLPHLSQEYKLSDNDAERAALLRLEILFKEGGLVVDHDTECLTPFDPLNESHNLYAPLKPRESTFLSSNVQVAPAFLGACAHHPLIYKVIEATKERWHEMGDAFSGDDYASTLYRVNYRVQDPLDEALFFHLGESDQLIPHGQFAATYGRHHNRLTWANDPDKFIKQTQATLIKIKRQQKWLLSLSALLGVLTLLNGLKSWTRKRS